jgi:hypothetical protein
MTFCSLLKFTGTLLKTEAVYFCETSVSSHAATQRHGPETVLLSPL